jgi:hypothetical protein
VEAAVLYLLLVLAITGLSLAALLWGGTRLIQGGLYEEPAEDLHWRGPAAAGAVTAFLALWCLLNYVAMEPGQNDVPYNALFAITATQDSPLVSEFWAEFPTGKEHYRRVSVGSNPPRHEYRRADDNRVWQTTRAREVQAIVVKEGDRETTFKPEAGKGRYAEEGGRRYMADDALGRITTPRTGGLWVSLLLNVLHFVVWFVCLWLLLRYNWPHALGLAAVFWLVMTFVVPTIFDKVPRKSLPPPPTSAGNGTRMTRI